jgi:hypothetical protein
LREVLLARISYESLHTGVHENDHNSGRKWGEKMRKDGKGEGRAVSEISVSRAIGGDGLDSLEIKNSLANWGGASVGLSARDLEASKVKNTAYAG